MEDRIVEFAGLLRRSGIRVSTAETLDALRAVEQTGLTDRASFKTALRAAMVKRAPDVPVYDELFENFFSGIGNVVRAASEQAAGAMPLSEEQLRQLLETISQLLANEGLDVSELAKALAMQDAGEMERLLRELDAPPSSAASTIAATQAISSQPPSSSLFIVITVYHACI